jgi:hypothetical protein
VKTAWVSGIYLASARTPRTVGFAFALAFLFQLLSPGFSMANDTAKFSDLQIALDDDEVTAGRKASLIRSLNEKELQAFVVEMAKVFPAKTSFEAGQALRTIEVLRRHKSFAKPDAKVLVTSLAKQKAETSFDGRIRATRIRLMAVSGDLNKSILDQELSFLAEANRPSADRLALIGALTDAMTELGQKPSVETLEKFLANDVYEIRIHAIDWFRLSLPLPLADRIRFLKTAIRVSPFQARERAYRALLSSDDKEFLAIYRAVSGPINGSEVTVINCALDSNEKTRKLCQDAEAKALMMEKGKAK